MESRIKLLGPPMEHAPGILPFVVALVGIGIARVTAVARDAERASQRTTRVT